MEKNMLPAYATTIFEGFNALIDNNGKLGAVFVDGCKKSKVSAALEGLSERWVEFLDLLDRKEAVSEDNLVWEEKLTSQENVDNGWHTDAMPNLPNWSEFQKGKSKKIVVVDDMETEVEQVSIQRLMFWFVSHEQDGLEYKLPVVDQAVKVVRSNRDRPKKVMPPLNTVVVFKDDRETWTDGIVIDSHTGARRVEENSILILNGWIANGIQLKSACDGSSVKGISRFNREGSLIIERNRRALGAPPNPVWERLVADGLLAWGVENAPDPTEMEEMVIHFTDQWVNGVVCYDSPIKEMSTELVEFFKVKEKERIAANLDQMEIDGRALGLKTWSFEMLKDIIEFGVNNKVPLWDGGGGGIYSMIPAPWELVSKAGSNRWGRGKLPIHRIREIGTFARSYVKMAVQGYRWLGQFEEGEFVHSMLSGYVLARFKIAQRARWADVRNTDKETEWQEAQLRAKAKVVYGGSGFDRDQFDAWCKSQGLKTISEIEADTARVEAAVAKSRAETIHNDPWAKPHWKK